MDVKEIWDKCILTEEELEIFKKNMDKMDHTHARDFRTMMNPIRRDIIKTIGYEVKTTEKLGEELDLELDQLEYHLSMVEQTIYVQKTKDGWKLTPRGVGFLNNTSIEF